MTGSNPMSFFSDNVDAWGPLEWFDRLAKAVHARSRAVSEKDDLSFELYQNIASSSATRLVSDFEDKVRMALTTLRELEKANVAYVDANTELLSTLESLQRENEALKRDRYDLAYAITGGEDAPGLLDTVPTSQLVEIARDTHRSHSADIDRAIAAEGEVKRLTESRDGYVKQRDQLQKLYDDERASCIREAKLATDMAADCYDAQARAETAESCLTQLRKAVGELLDQAEHVCLGAHTPANIKEAARNLATPIKNVRTALASTGGEHNGN